MGLVGRVVSEGDDNGAAHALTSNRIMPRIRNFALTIIVNHR